MPLRITPSLKLFCCCLFPWETHTSLREKRLRNLLCRAKVYILSETSISCLRYLKLLRLPSYPSSPDYHLCTLITSETGGEE